MAWTTPQTWTTGQVVSAADMNTDIRDNMLETGPATAQAAGDIVYADAANSMGSRVAHPGQSRMLVSDASSALAWRQPAEDASTESGQVTSTSYTSNFLPDGGGGFTDPGPSVTVTTGTLAIVKICCEAMGNATASAATWISFSISGATSTAANDNQSARVQTTDTGQRISAEATRQMSLTAGSNTFQMEARVSSGTGTIIRPRILVIPY